jgi:hypothetical protein
LGVSAADRFLFGGAWLGLLQALFHRAQSGLKGFELGILIRHGFFPGENESLTT